jgi:hypothetical protein
MTYGGFGLQIVAVTESRESRPDMANLSKTDAQLLFAM